MIVLGSGTRVVGTEEMVRVEDRPRQVGVVRVDARVEDRDDPASAGDAEIEDVVRAHESAALDECSAALDIKREAKKALKVEQILGTWTLAVVRENGKTRESRFSITQHDGKLKGVFSSQRGDRDATKIELKGDTLIESFEMHWH